MRARVGRMAHLLRRALLVAALVLVGTALNPVGAAARTPTTAPQGMNALEDSMHASDRISFADSTTMPIAIVPPAAGPNLISQTIMAVASKNMDGVNVDFEGSGSALFPDIPNGITGFMTQLSSAMHARWPQSEVSIDTYAGAASWDGGIFKI